MPPTTSKQDLRDRKPLVTSHDVPTAKPGDGEQYMAPEQLRSERALKASDLWALGEIVYEVATGRHPFFAPGERLTLTEALDRLGEPPQRPDMLSDEMWDFISRSLNDPPYKRGTLTKAAIRIAGEKYGSR